MVLKYGFWQEIQIGFFREEYVVYDSDSFIADVGGFFGLLLGQSMLGIYYMSVEWIAKSNIFKIVQ